MFVLSPVGPTFDLKTDYAVSDFERPRAIFGARPVGFLALRKILLKGKLFRLRVYFSSFFLSGKLFPFLRVRARTNIFTQSAVKRESALC